MIRVFRHKARLFFDAHLRVRVLSMCVAHPRLASLYYVVSPAFQREHRAVLAGRLRHLTGQAGAAETGRFTLRRNIHRIEKGLIMRPRRDVFAAAYIGPTVSLYAQSVAATNACSATSSGDNSNSRGWGIDNPDTALNSWAGDVLYRYFEAVAPGLNHHADAARDIYYKAHPGIPYQPGSSSPFVRDTEALPVSIEDFEHLASRRRSVRWYQDKRVPRELLDRATRAAVEAPSACNRQPFEFRIYDEPDLAQRIGAIPMGTAGFSQNFPCLIVVVAKLRAFPLERDRHVPYIDASLATMGLLFALETLGLASCCINWPDIESREMAMEKTIGLDRDQRVVMCISVGYPLHEGMVPYSRKKTLSEIRSYNQLPTDNR